MSARLQTHYIRKLGDHRAICGRDVLGLSASTCPLRIKCQRCLQDARLQKEIAHAKAAGARLDALIEEKSNA